MSPLRLHALIFCSWVLSLTGQPVEGGGSTHLQVVAEPGVTIFVDEKSQGETTAHQGGLIVPDIKPGEHTLRAEKEDCVPKTIKVNVDAGSVFKWKVGDFVPSLKVIRERGQEKEDAAFKQKTQVNMTFKFSCLETQKGVREPFMNYILRRIVGQAQK